MRAEIENGKKLSFLEVYHNIISPKLMEIDVMLKTMTSELCITEISKVLEIASAEIKSIIHEQNIKTLGRQEFLKIMYHGSSYICTLYRRELDRGSPYLYTREDISYIYNLDKAIVDETCDRLNILEATAFTLPEIFAAINVL